jgi:hypothetical protein
MSELVYRWSELAGVLEYKSVKMLKAGFERSAAAWRGEELLEQFVRLSTILPGSASELS